MISAVVGVIVVALAIAVIVVIAKSGGPDPGELSVGPLVAKTDRERIARQSVLQQVEADFHAIPFDDRAARAFGRVAAELRATGRKTTARAYDALIAATAVANELPFFTVNVDDFSGISSLTVVEVELV